VDFSAAHPIARAILYEGYLLYPYRRSSVKNRQASPIGALYPKAYSEAGGGIEPWAMQTEFLVHGDSRATIQGLIRFLQAVEGGGIIEREVSLPPRPLADIIGAPSRSSFTFHCGESSFEVAAALSCEAACQSMFKFGLRITNETHVDSASVVDCSQAVMRSTHAVLGVEHGRFLSLIDPPADARDLAQSCRNRGAWPVLVGNRARQDMLLAAPIILDDFPQVARQSPGDLFDGTEIDELLTLRILTLTDAEKDVMRRDEQARAILARTEQLADDQLRALHGTLRTHPDFGPGARVRLHPRGRADIFDLALDGKLATVASIEEDFEGRVLYTVTLDDDPGRDLGELGKPGHRFFFGQDEIELLEEDHS
jgi:hypothetical protein